MKIILGLVKPRSGELTFDGASTLGLTDAADRPARHRAPCRRRAGCSRDMSVRENILMGAFVRNDSAEVAQRSRTRCWRCFPTSGERLSQRAGSLSGGEQQMVAMARALMSRPRMIVHGRADHGPFAALRRSRAGPDQDHQQGGRHRSSWSSRTPAWRWRSPTRPMCCRPAVSFLSGPARALKDDPRIRDAYLGGAEVA